MNCSFLRLKENANNCKKMHQIGVKSVTFFWPFFDVAFFCPHLPSTIRNKPFFCTEKSSYESSINQYQISVLLSYFNKKQKRPLSDSAKYPLQRAACWYFYRTLLQSKRLE